MAKIITLSQLIKLANEWRTGKKSDIDIVQSSVPKPLPIVRRTILNMELKALIEEKFPTGKIYLSDPSYDLCDIEDIEALLDVDETNHHKYVKHKFDCENFTALLWGQFNTPEWSPFAIGYFWSNTHAMLLCVDANEDIWLIEPQTDARASDLLGWQGTKMRFVVI